MSDAATTILEKHRPLPRSLGSDPTDCLSTPVRTRRASGASDRRDERSYFNVDFESLSSFVNRYPQAWHAIREVLGSEEALRLAQLRRNQAMTLLRVEHRWSLQAIGDLFDLSRERVRQLTPTIDGNGVTPELESDRPSDPAEIRKELEDAFRKVVRTPEAWNGRGQVSKSWIVEYLGYEPDLPDLDFRRLSDSKALFILKHGLDLDTKKEMRAWFEEMYFERSMTYAEIARWLSREFVSVAPMTVHRTATSLLGFEGFGRGKRNDR